MPAGSPIPEDLLRSEAEAIAARYRVSVEEAEDALGEAFRAAPEVARHVRERRSREDVTRWHEYREIIKNCRKEVYYGLRQYYRSPSAAEQLVDDFERAVAAGRPAGRIEALRRELQVVEQRISRS